MGQTVSCIQPNSLQEMLYRSFGIGCLDEVSFLVRVFPPEKEQGHLVGWARILGHEITCYLEEKNGSLEIVRMLKKNG